MSNILDKKLKPGTEIGKAELLNYIAKINICNFSEIYKNINKLPFNKFRVLDENIDLMQDNDVFIDIDHVEDGVDKKYFYLARANRGYLMGCNGFSFKSYEFFVGLRPIIRIKRYVI